VSFVYPEVMISSQEFQQALQAGKIHEALALLVRDAVEIDVTTRLAEDSVSSQNSREYLRTKINLLTGTVENEVGTDVIADSNRYLKLHQLHTDRIATSDRIVHRYLDQLKAILTDLSTSSLAPPHQQHIESVRLEPNSLAARLAQAALLLKKKDHGIESTVSDTSQPQQSPLAAQIATSQVSPDPVAIDDDLDLSIDPDGAVWEEWVEDEDFRSESILPPPSSPLAPLTTPDDEDNLVRRQLNPLTVKPITPRSNPESVTSAPRWDKFAPDYIDTDAQSRLAKHSEPHN
jgi:hypothetical protein